MSREVDMSREVPGDFPRYTDAGQTEKYAAQCVRKFVYAMMVSMRPRAAGRRVMSCSGPILSRHSSESP